MQLHRLITKVGGATTTANFCFQIITEQFDKVQLTQKHEESNHAGQNGRLYTVHCSLVNGFKVGQNVSVSGLRCFIEFSGGVSILPVNAAAVAALGH